MKSATLQIVTGITLFAALAVPARLTAQSGNEHHRYKLIILSTLGGPQSYGDAGHGVANLPCWLSP